MNGEQLVEDGKGGGGSCIKVSMRVDFYMCMCGLCGLWGEVLPEMCGDERVAARPSPWRPARRSL